MFATRPRASGSEAGNGCHRETLTALQRRGADPDCQEGLRRRLKVLAERLRRVQALGGEFAQVGFSEHVRDLLDECAATI